MSATAPSVVERMQPTRSPLVRARDISLVLDGRRVLDEVSIEVRPGEVVGLVGRNGAGKTTLLHVLLGLTKPDSGSVTRAADLSVGVAFDKAALPSRARVRTAIDHVRRYVGAAPSGTLASGLIGDLLERRVDSLSHGMLQRLSVAAAVIGEPTLLVLDEPYNGLDPLAMSDLTSLVRTVAAAGNGVLVSTHYLSPLDELCDRVVVIDAGHVVVTETAAALSRGAVLELDTADPAGALCVLRGHGLAAREESGRIVVEPCDRLLAAAVVRRLVDGGIDVFAVEPRSPRLADLVEQWLRPVVEPQ